MRVRSFSNVVYVEFCESIDLECNSRVHSLDRALATNRPAWLLEAVPSYSSLALVVDPTVLGSAAIAGELKRMYDSIAASDLPRAGTSHELPVRYGGEDGPDIGFVAATAGVTVEQVIQLHTSRKYHCYMLGFTPGFVYLGDVDDRIAVPRLETPRLKVPAGSVGIAGKQTGFYGVESPGGWRIIGRLQAMTFDAEREPPSTISPGDSVKFVRV